MRNTDEFMGILDSTDKNSSSPGPSKRATQANGKLGRANACPPAQRPHADDRATQFVKAGKDGESEPPDDSDGS